MNKQQQEKIEELLLKYNDVLLASMRIAISEDFTNLMIKNQDDKDFLLKDLVNEKSELSKFVVQQFLKINSSSVASELSSMPEKKLTLRKQTKLKF